MNLHLIDVCALLALALLLAKALGVLTGKLRLPSVLAELLAGVVLGNLGLLTGWNLSALENSDLVKGLSELGILFLLFLVGLETNLQDIRRVGKEAALAAFAGVVAPAVFAFLTIPVLFPQFSFSRNLFLATALTATSVGITARVLRDIGQQSSVSGRIILGAAVIDDILGIVVLSLVSALVVQGSFDVLQLLFLLGKIAAFFLFFGFLRVSVFPKLFRTSDVFEVSGTATIILLSLCLLAAWLSEKAGLAGIIGAFAMGVALDDVKIKMRRKPGALELEKVMKPITHFLTPVFFVTMGMGVKLPVLFQRDSLTLAVVLLVCGILGKLICGFAVDRQSRKQGGDPWLVGFGMIPRGEVGLIFAALGLRLGILGSSDYSALVIMVAATTFIAPALLHWRSRLWDGL